MRWRASGWILLGLGLTLGNAGATPWPGRAARVERELASEDVELRRRAARELGALSDATARRAVEKALSDDDLEVRLVGARRARELALAGLGSIVVPWLREPHAELRLAALLLLQNEPSAVSAQELGHLLADPSRDVRRAAVEVFGLFFDRPLEVNAFLGGALSDPDPEVRIALARALGRSGGPGASRLLTGFLKDPDKEVRRAAVVAWGALGEPEAEAALLLGLEDSDASVAEAAARSWSLWREPAVVPQLLAWFTRAPWSRVHEELSLGLGFEDDVRIAEALVSRALESSEPEVLLRALARRGEVVTPVLERCAREALGSKLVFCLRALVARERERRAGDVTRAVRAGRLTERAALEVLRGAADSEDALIFALERLTREDARVRALALQVLEASARLDAALLEPVRHALGAPGLPVAERARLLGLLAQAPSPEDFSRAEKFLEATDARLGRSAARVLAHGPEPEEIVRLLGHATWGEIVADELGRSPPPLELARALVRRLEEAGARERARLARALAELPADAPREIVEGLARRLELLRGDERDLLLGLLLRLDHAAPELERWARRGDRDDRALLAARAAERKTPELARLLGEDPDPEVRLLAWGSLGTRGASEDIAPLAARLDSASRRERLALLLALAELGRRHPGRLGPLLAPSSPNEPASSHTERDPALRLAELTYAAVQGAPDVSERAHRALLLDDDPTVRSVAARVLAEQSPSGQQAASARRALQAAAFYDPDRFVAALAADLARARPAPRGEERAASSPVEPPRPHAVLVRRADGSGPLPSALVPAFDARGRFVLLRTDRAGRAVLPDANARLLAPSLLY